MKKIAVIILFLNSLLIFAQEESSDNENFKLFIGGGVLFTNEYEINKYLNLNNIQPITPVQINANAGIIFYNKNVDIDLGYELFASGKSNDKTKNRTLSNGVKFRAHYVFTIAKDLEIGTGFNISYGKRKLIISYKDYNLDFNNLPLESIGNQITLFIEKAYLGPSVCLKIKNTGRNNQQTKITFSYEMPINNKSWNSDFLNLQNKINEKKNKQFVINVSFAL